MKPTHSCTLIPKTHLGKPWISSTCFCRNWGKIFSDLGHPWNGHQIGPFFAVGRCGCDQVTSWSRGRIQSCLDRFHGSNMVPESRPIFLRPRREIPMGFRQPWTEAIWTSIFCTRCQMAVNTIGQPLDWSNSLVFMKWARFEGVGR